MKIAVLGSTGMAGHVVAQYLQESGHQVFRASRSEKDTSMSAAIDVTNFSALGAWLDTIDPNVVINCIGLLQRACDERTDLAVLINSYFPHWLEQRFWGTNTRVIHLSTDCVFSGTHGGYVESDFPDGVTIYDRTKAIGELNNQKDLTFRMSIIGPDIDPQGTGLFNWFMMQHGQIQGWTMAIWNGVTTTELARAINAAISCGLTGLYHLVPENNIDKYSLLNLFAQIFSRSDVEVVKADGPKVNKSLRCTRKDFPFAVKAYPEQVADMRSWVYSHPSFYSHYEK